MFETLPQIEFDYICRQGRFRIFYWPFGLAGAIPYLRPAGENLDNPDMAGVDEHCACRMVWDQAQPVADDLRDMPEPVVMEKYQRLFREQDAAKTLLETPDEQLRPLLVIPAWARNDLPFLICFRADGRGWISHDRQFRWKGQGHPAVDLSHPFVHNIGADRITADIEVLARGGTASQALANHYTNLFWDSINPRFESPLIRSNSELATTKVTTRKGTLEQFRSLVQDACSIDDALWTRGTEADAEIRSISFFCASPARGCWIDDRANKTYRDLSRKNLAIIKAVMAWAEPTGYYVSDAYGSPLDWSGFRKLSLKFDCRVSPPTSSERLEALERLLLWSEQEGVKIGKFLPE